MSILPNTTEHKVSRTLNVRTVVLLVLVVLITLFCAFNRAIVYVWPFGNAVLYVVILLAYGIGLSSGWLVKSLLGEKVAEKIVS